MQKIGISDGLIEAIVIISEKIAMAGYMCSMMFESDRRLPMF